MSSDIGAANQQIDIASSLSLLYDAVCTLADELATLGAVIEQLERLPGLRE